jgi:thiol:disulfide interchange protein DsbD
MKRLPTALLALLGFLSPIAPAAEDELLEADAAFALTTRLVNPETLEARWKIAPGYYLYRDKFKFESLDEAVVLKPPVVPEGEKKDDPLFGRVETFTTSVRIKLPIERKNPEAHNARLRITAQGCNEPIGVCYPPVVKEVAFKLPAVKAAAPPRETLTARAIPARDVRSLTDLTKAVSPAAEPEVPDPEKAFTVAVGGKEPGTLLVRFAIADCCYLYRDKTKFEITRADGVRLGDYRLPPGKVKIDEFIGKTEVYDKGFEMTLPIEGLGAQDAGFDLGISYQGCSEKVVSICYPPRTRNFRIGWERGALISLGESTTGASAPAAEKAPADSRPFIFAVLAAFGTGLLLTFTPCVLPMIPILSSIVVGTSDGHITRLRGGLLSGSYVLGTAVTYTVAGVVAGASGEQLQAYFQNAWALGIFSALFVALALSMFGFYELHVPAAVQSFLHHHGTRWHARGKRTKGGVFIGVFIMGLLSALIIGACVSPLLITALGAAIAGRDPVLGGAIMFSMSLGMGMVLIALGVGAGFLLPRAGPWMSTVKHVFGALLLAVAIYLLGFLPEVPVLLLWAALLIVAAVYLGATQGLPPGASGWRYLWKGLGTFLLIWGVLALLGGLAGNRDILNPLPITFSRDGITLGVSAEPKAKSPAEHLFERVKSLRELEERLMQARGAGKPAILDYYADWCTDCLRMEQTTFADPQVRAELTRRFVLLQADVTDPNNAEVKAVKNRFGVFGPPALLFFSSRGEELPGLRTYGFRNKDEFLALLRQVN